MRLARDFAELGTDQLLDRIRAGSWLKLPALSVATADERKSVESLATLVLQALAEEARARPTLTDVTLLNRTLRVADVGQVAASKGGYLNDLIAASADQVFLLSAWILLDKAPTLATELLPAIEARSKLNTAKTWLAARYSIDPDLVAKKEILDAIKPDASGFQAVMQIQKRGRDINSLPTVLEQVRKPEIALLWWAVYTIDYRIVVLRAGIAYVDGGGTFTGNMNDFRAKCVSIFGKNELPFKHELKRGSIFPESISREWSGARDEAVREMQTAQWFGKP